METSEPAPSLNILGEALESCSTSPLTGYFRDGCCNTCSDDEGSHTVCIEISSHFLNYSRFKGNDLSTAHPDVGFPGLKPGDRWCLCASRWLQAYEEGMAPKVHLESTHERCLDIIPLAFLTEYSITSKAAG